jgi:hypothetical protein
MKREFKLYFGPEWGPKTPDQKPDWTCKVCGKLNPYSANRCIKQGCSGTK